MNRRNFIRSVAGLLIPAPMVVRAESLMAVRPLIPEFAVCLHYGRDDRTVILEAALLSELGPENRATVVTRTIEVRRLSPAALRIFDADAARQEIERAFRAGLLSKPAEGRPRPPGFTYIP